MPTVERSRVPLAIAIAAYLAFLAYQSLAGAAHGACGPLLVQQGARLSRGDGLANLVAYFPLGLLAASLAASLPAKRIALVAAFLSISAFSLGMELAQACLPGRVSSWYDWVTNSAGGLAGLFAGPVAEAGLRRMRARHAPAAAELALWWAALLCVGAWMAMSTAPWRFTLDVGTVRSNLSFIKQVAALPPLDPWALGRHLFGWSAIGIALCAIGPAREAATRWLLPAMAAAAGAQALLTVRVLSIEELAGMATALAACRLVLPSIAQATLARLAGAPALLSVAAYQLAPRHGAALADGFSWWPQLGRGGLVAALELALFFGWLGFTLALSLRWSAQLGEDIARRRIALPASFVGALFVTELAQCRIPGRTPDTSAPLVVALAFVAAWALTGVSLTDRVRSR